MYKNNKRREILEDSSKLATESEHKIEDSRNKGITIISLIIMVVIMMLFIGVSVKIGTDLIHKSKIEDIKTNMLTIQGKARIIKEKSDFGEGELTGDSMDSINMPNALQTELDKISKPKYRVLLQNHLEKMGLGNIKTDINKNEFYIVDYKNDCEVYYSLGIDGKYSLTELKDM